MYVILFTPARGARIMKMASAYTRESILYRLVCEDEFCYRFAIELSHVLLDGSTATKVELCGV
jgi:hypothetical protein